MSPSCGTCLWYSHADEEEANGRCSVLGGSLVTHPEGFCLDHEAPPVWDDLLWRFDFVGECLVLKDTSCELV